MIRACMFGRSRSQKKTLEEEEKNCTVLLSSLALRTPGVYPKAQLLKWTGRTVSEEGRSALVCVCVAGDAKRARNPRTQFLRFLLWPAFVGSQKSFHGLTLAGARAGRPNDQTAPPATVTNQLPRSNARNWDYYWFGEKKEYLLSAALRDFKIPAEPGRDRN